MRQSDGGGDGAMSFGFSGSFYERQKTSISG